MRWLYALLALLTTTLALSIVPSVNFMETAGRYPEATVLAEALCGLDVNSNLVNTMMTDHGDPLIAALALKVLGYQVPPSLLTVNALTVCDKAEKAFVYKLLGQEGWKALIEEVLDASPSEVLNSGLGCACKAAFFALLSGYKPSWLNVIFLEMKGKKLGLDSLIWCSALDKLVHGNSPLEVELAKYILPNGALTPFPSSDLPDYYETAQFLVAYSLLQCGPKVKFKAVSTTTTSQVQRVSFITITQTLTTFVTSFIKKITTITRTVLRTAYVTSTVFTTVSNYITRTVNCLTLETPLTVVNTQTLTTTITLSPKSYVLRVLPYGNGSYQVVCNGGGTFYLGTSLEPYPQYVGGVTKWIPQGDFKMAPCDGSSLETSGKTVTVMVSASNPVTLTVTASAVTTSPVVVLCSK